MKTALSVIALSVSVYATTYMGCGATKQDALFELSGNIRSSIKNDFEQKTTINSTDEDVQTKISSYLNASTNLSLSNIRYKDKNDHEVCAFVEKEDQTKNTRQMLQSALLYNEKNLPKELHAKIEKLAKWLEDIKQLGFLMPVFLENSQKSQEILNKKEKIFSDLYAQSIAKSDSLVFKRCAQNDTEAKKALNKLLFKEQTKDEKQSFLSTVTSFFKSDKPLMIDLFTPQISYIKEDQKKCAIVKKDSLLNIATKMYADVERFNKNELDKNPKKRYKQINNYFEHLNVTKALIELYPKNFNDNAFNRIIQVRKELTEIQKKTDPQFVLFNIKGAEEINIQLDSKVVQNNKEIYTPKGDHTYTVSAIDKCPLTDTFSTDLFEDKTISEDFTKRNYPTVIFVSDKNPNIVVDGKVIKANVVTPIQKCNGEVRYVVKFAGQTKDGTLELEAGDANTVELNFLSAKELAVFNDAKTKNFTTTSTVNFSESLTPLASEKLTFKLEQKPQHGTLELHERGSFKYISDKEFVGVDSFEYIIKTEDKTSAPKIVNITVKPSNAPKTVVKKAMDELNTTKEGLQEKIEKKVEDVKQKIDEAAEERYKKFKAYVESQKDNIEKLKKLQKTYPEMFKRFIQEKTAP